MKKLTRIFGVVLTLAVAAPALAVDGSGGPDQLAAATFARDDGDDTDTTPPPEDPVVDPLADPPPEDPPPS